MTASAHSRESHEANKDESKDVTKGAKGNWQEQFAQPKDHSDQVIEMKSAQHTAELGGTL